MKKQYYPANTKVQTITTEEYRLEVFQPKKAYEVLVYDLNFDKNTPMERVTCRSESQLKNLIKKFN